MTVHRNFSATELTRRRLLQGAGLGLAGLALPRAAGAGRMATLPIDTR